jgi:hypothetical protein
MVQGLLKRRHVGQALGASAVIAALANCASPASAPPATRPSAPEATLPRAAAPSPPVASDDTAPPTANSTSAPDPKSPAPAAPRPAREGAPGSTRGTVSCGTTRCTAPGQACFADEEANAWLCRDADPVDPEAAMHYTGGDPGTRCDDGFDCPDGQTCCVVWGYGVQACVKRSDVSSYCSREVCVQGGARCPPGRTCNATSPYEGACEPPEGPATCAMSRRCPKDAPICILTDHGARCVADGSPEHDAVPAHRRYHCTHQRDCHAGEVCQYVFGEIEHETATYCGPYRPQYRGSVVCDPSKPPPCGGDPECEALNKCNKPRGDMAKHLPWLGVQ